MKEAEIVINGVVLTEGQSSTVRCALVNFLMDLVSGGLGSDDHGILMRKFYIQRVREIEQIIRGDKNETNNTN